MHCAAQCKQNQPICVVWGDTSLSSRTNHQRISDRCSVSKVSIASGFCRELSLMAADDLGLVRYGFRCMILRQSDREMPFDTPFFLARLNCIKGKGLVDACECAVCTAPRAYLGAVISFLFSQLHRHPPILRPRSDSIMQATYIMSVESIGAASASYVDGSFWS